LIVHCLCYLYFAANASKASVIVKEKLANVSSLDKIMKTYLTPAPAEH